MNTDIRLKNLLTWRKAFKNDSIFAHALDISPSYYGQIKRGEKLISEKSARKFEKNLGYPEGSLDQPVDEDGNAIDVSSILRGCTIPVLSATASMGPGITSALEHDEQVETFRATKRWIQSKLSHASSPDNIRIITGLGDSMMGTYNHGDALFVDTGITALDVDAVYVMEYDDELYIKRIQRSLGTYTMISDNPSYRDVDIPKEKLADLRVIGRVIGAMNFKEV